MSGPTRQRSLRERIQSASRGIGISWQGKKSKSYHSKESLSEAQSSESEAETRNKDEIESDGANNRTKEQDTTEKSAEPVANRDDGVSVGEKKALGRTLTQPQGTEQYMVEPSDTLAGIAARFDTTPSELAKLNRLAARIIFPGQLLFVPEKRNKSAESGNEEAETSGTLAPPQNEKERRPSVTDALRIPYRRASEKAHRFLKVKARHFTDGQGVVSGVLIITPNAVMFDPNVSDPLVIEHGVESYGVIAPLDMLMRAAIYFDIAHMKVQHAAPQDTGPRPKADVYYGKIADESSSEEPALKCPPLEDTTPCIKVLSSPPSTPQEIPPAAPEPEEPAQIPKVQDASESQSTVHTTAPSSQSVPLETVENSPAPMPISGDSVDSLDAEVIDAFAGVENQAQDAPSESRRERMLKRLSYPMESITSISRILTSSPKSFVDFSGSLFSGRVGSEDEVGRDEIKEEQPDGATSSEQQGKEPIGYQNLVEEKPEIFAQLDKLLRKHVFEEEGQPLYLCLRMGIPKEPKPQPLTVLSYGKKRARSEYWFSIPLSRVEDLYNFLQQWIPQLYGEVDDIDPEESGFIPIDDSLPDDEDEEVVDLLKSEGGDQEEGEGAPKEAPKSFLKLVEETFGFKSMSQADWEVLSLSEMDSIDYSMELPVPELEDKSEIIETEHITALYQLVPPRAYSHSWKRIFSTNEDGFNLRTLYRKMGEYDCPVFIFVKNTKDEVFGAFLSTPLRQSDSFYGTGESFLFTFQPTFKEFKWTGQNDYFVKGNMDSISIGASKGHFGLWLDGDLYRGTSVRCQTYDNDPLASSNDFFVKNLEAWVFT